MTTLARTLAFLLGTLCLAHAAPHRSPNILILYADDLGYGDLGCQNPESKIPTPHLDRLAAEGLRFTDAHSSSGICTPSRYALLTGRYHWRKFHGIVNSFELPVLDPAELTLAEMLRAQGYRTACIGKWHLGWNWHDLAEPATAAGVSPPKSLSSDSFRWDRPLSGGPRSHGFDYYFGDDVPNFPPYAWFENDRLLTLPSTPLKLQGSPREGAWETRPGPMTPGWAFDQVVPRLADRTVSWIHEQRDRPGPFFLYVPFNSPHAPIVPSPEFTGTSRAGAYGDFVTQTDAVVGRILQALEDTGLARDTLVLFSSDNGPEHYAYDRFRLHGHRSMGPLRGLKRDLYEGGHRVPLLVRWPGVVKPGRVTPTLISQVDLLATLAAVTGARPAPGAGQDSLNFLPVLQGAPRGPRRNLVHNTIAGAYALRHDRWLLIEHRSGSHTAVPDWFQRDQGFPPHDQPGELYDLATDLGQKTNLYSARPRQVAVLRRLLHRLQQTPARNQIETPGSTSSPADTGGSFGNVK
ncbi:MAG: arylsulfatase [Verrucomicrobiales bacterium]|nr:arylsulfatase [Verrucomicrobiales bacterium]